MMAMAQGGPVAISYAHCDTRSGSRPMFYDSYANRYGMTAEASSWRTPSTTSSKQAGVGRISTFRRVFTVDDVPEPPRSR